MTDPIKSLVQIDLMRLDEHWAYQPKLYHRWAKKIPRAKERLVRAEVEEKLAEAEMSQRIREAPEKFIEGKVTEPAIKAAIARSKKVRLATQRVIRLRRVVDDLDVAVKTADQKKRSLEKLVDLEARDYFSQPRAPRHVDPELRRHLTENRKKRLRRRGYNE